MPPKSRRPNLTCYQQEVCEGTKEDDFSKSMDKSGHFAPGNALFTTDEAHGSCLILREKGRGDSTHPPDGGCFKGLHHNPAGGGEYVPFAGAEEDVGGLAIEGEPEEALEALNGLALGEGPRGGFAFAEDAGAADGERLALAGDPSKKGGDGQAGVHDGRRIARMGEGGQMQAAIFPGCTGLRKWQAVQ